MRAAAFSRRLLSSAYKTKEPLVSIVYAVAFMLPAGCSPQMAPFTGHWSHQRRERKETVQTPCSKAFTNCLTPRSAGGRIVGEPTPKAVIRHGQRS